MNYVPQFQVLILVEAYASVTMAPRLAYELRRDDVYKLLPKLQAGGSLQILRVVAGLSFTSRAVPHYWYERRCTAETGALRDTCIG